MEKSAEAFRAISEVAEIVDVPQHVLRFWETRFTQVRPVKRGSGRRYYRPADIDLLQGIKRLLYEEGYTIKGVQKLLKDNGVGFISAIGSGDLAKARAIAQEKQKKQLQNELFPEDILPESKMVGEKGGRGNLFGFFKHDEGKKQKTKSRKLEQGTQLAQDDASLLQEVLFELIECKRLLDRSHTAFD